MPETAPVPTDAHQRNGRTSLSFPVLTDVHKCQTALPAQEGQRAAYGVGFKSVPHFNRKFRERFGVTPTGFRRAEPGAEA